MRALAILGCLALAACSGMSYGPTRPATVPVRASAPDIYVVRTGDTLYSIAFRYGLDQRQLAAWNRITNPNRIFVGQRLSLRGPATAAPAPQTRTQRQTARSAPAPARAPAPATRAAPLPPQPQWAWPARGRVVARFGDKSGLSTGIGIAGAVGQDIQAAAPGRVVYAGSGLPDYGQLVIIEHNDTWLSAYGHNRRLLVSQGQTVDRGQKIAEMGPGPGGEPRLHFEIRRNGDPVDPLSLLPASG